ncbi:MAG: hypothetical protein ACTHOL_17950 [Luteibacter jiangsuensis]
MTYTTPELSAERRICRRLLAQVCRDPCGHCIHRVTGWGRSACKANRTFPMCTKQRTGPSFEPDHSTLHEEEAIHG